MAQQKHGSAVAVERVTKTILVLREQRVLLDAGRAWLYGVTRKVLNPAVKCDAGRFPGDVTFHLILRRMPL